MTPDYCPHWRYVITREYDLRCLYCGEYFTEGTAQ